eukprot:TRINITY_DN589_c0_g1_i2.p1 TRINITY_DN589_c0_g1~~TRINITY_DN589_c0_g1_i2.p1  ORF type:complete len:119 (-),score=23.11 TRINITY_DN589_c0_g1_i2:45-401(-)
MEFAARSNVNRPRPPEKGSFPLDHLGECTEHMKEYIKCVEQNDNRAYACVHFSREYLQCRMDRGLMEKQELDSLGLKENSVDPTKIVQTERKEDSGFVPGSRRRRQQMVFKPREDEKQ